jgi:hemolysin activation/secretion protein
VTFGGGVAPAPPPGKPLMMIMKPLMKFAVALAWAAPTAALAQIGSTILDQDRADRVSPTVPAAPPKVEGAVAVQGPQTKVKPFVLREVRIDGATVPIAKLRPAWAPFIGRSVGEPELKTLADAVAAAYARSDVSLYTILTPRQTFQGGILHLAVVEGFLEDVKVTGDGNGRLVQAYADQMKHDMPLRRSKLERYLSLMRDIPGVKIDVQLLRGTRIGGVVMQITARRRRIEEGLSVNNRGTAYLGSTQVKADIWFDGLTRQGDQTRVTFAAPTDFDRFHYYAVSQVLALDKDGATATLSGGYITTKPAVGNTQGRADNWSVQVSKPVIRSYKDNLYVTGDIDASDSTNTAYGQELYSERVRAARGAVAYSKQTANTALSFSSTLSFGIDAFGAHVAAAGWSKPDFVKLNVAAKFSHAFGKQWVMRFDAAGQYSGDRLPGSEQFSLGGDEFGRAYPSAIATGDRGAAASLELAYRLTHLPKAVEGSELYGFIDGGGVEWSQRPSLAGYSRELSSWGLGARVAVLSKGVVELEAADAYTPPLATESRGWRTTLSVRSLLN